MSEAAELLQGHYDTGIGELVQSMHDLEVSHQEVEKSFRNLMQVRQKLAKLQGIHHAAVAAGIPPAKAAKPVATKAAKPVAKPLLALPTLQATVPRAAVVRPFAVGPLTASGKGAGANVANARQGELDKALSAALSAIARALSEAGGQMPMQELCNLESVKQARHGAIGSMQKFFLKHANFFALDTDPAKPSDKVVRLLRMPPGCAPIKGAKGAKGAGAKGTGGVKRTAQTAFGASATPAAQPPPATREQAEQVRAQIIQMAVAIVRRAGGEVALNDICIDPGVASARKGVVGSMFKFLNENENFEVFDGPAGEEGKGTRPMVRLTEASEELSSGPHDPDEQQAALVAYVQSKLQEAAEYGEASVKLKDLEQDKEMIKLRKGVASALGPWLETQPELFHVFSLADETGRQSRYVGLLSQFSKR